MHMQSRRLVALAIVLGALVTCSSSRGADAPLPAGVRAVWDLDKALHEATPTREQISINGLWRWQPAEVDSTRVPGDDWGFFKVPGCWPGINDYMQKDCQTVYAHPSWRGKRMAGINAAWYQREITIPAAWAGRRIAVHAEYVNSLASVYLDGRPVGDIRFPAGTLDLSAACRAGQKQTLSMLVVALPLRGVMLAYNDTNSARQVKGSVPRRGLCGDLLLLATPRGPQLGDVRVATSVRRWEITLDSAVTDLVAGKKYQLRARISDQGRAIQTLTSKLFQTADVQRGRISWTAPWHPEKLWDTDTPGNQYDVSVSLIDTGGDVLDTGLPVRFGFREFWIDGRDFYLNGTRIFLCAVPFDNAQVGVAWSTYEQARESMRRLRSFGINAVYTHNYSCTPGAHLSFTEILRAADDEGVLVSFSQPHFGQYEWDAKDADRSNGYADHAAFYVRVAQNHPAVVMYSMSHNSTGYSEDMNPNLIDGIHAVRSEWSMRNVRRALRAEAIVKSLDPSRIVYHHSSGNLSSMHTVNFYPNWVPIQELSDWFEHWATTGVKPFFSCEYGAPFMWDWAMYRGWYKGKRNFGSAAAPWDFCLAEWNSQFLGDQAYKISDEEKADLRWEAKQYRAGRVWHRWDYPHQLGSRDFDERYPVLAAYLTDNWRAFRTWGVSAISPWEHGVYWKLRPGVNRNQHVTLETDWEHLQRPGFSPDYLEQRYERMDLAYAASDWIATPAADALYRNNGPLLAYIAGKPDQFTSKDHNFLPGEIVEKQLVIINNSRRTVKAACEWSFDLATRVSGARQLTIAAGCQERVTLRVPLPANSQPGTHTLNASVKFSTGEVQTDRFAVQVLAQGIAANKGRSVRPGAGRTAAGETVKRSTRTALFDPKGETRRLLAALGTDFETVPAEVDLSGFDMLIIGKGVLSADGPAPDLTRVRAGLRVVVFEQTAAALEKRLGFRVQEYGLRKVFPRVPDHPCLAGLDERNLCDWRGAATIVPPRLKYESSDKYNGVPAIRWCGLEVPRLWRCGNRGNVASVLIEKPAVGDFLPIVDGGFSLQYSPLLEYHEGRGMILFCQMDVTGRTEQDPAAMQIARNILTYVMASPIHVGTEHKALYVGPTIGRQWLQHVGIAAGEYRGGTLTPDRVLIVGRGGEKLLADNKQSLAQWLKAGGQMLALELDAEQANAFLPAPIATTKREYIAACFKPLGVDSLFAGVGPADVHNRDPRVLPLVSGGAEIVADGLLAQTATNRVVFCQLAPYAVVPGVNPVRRPNVGEGADSSFERWNSQQQNLRKTFRKLSFLVTRLLANMGVRGQTPLLSRFGSPVIGGQGKSIVKNSAFRFDTDNDGNPDDWQLDGGSKLVTFALEMTGSDAGDRCLRITGPKPRGSEKMSVMVAQGDVPVDKDQWYSISLKAKAKGLDGTDINLALQDTSSWRSLFDYQHFTPNDTWREFSFLVQANATAHRKTRFQIWYDKPGTLWLDDIRMTPCAAPTQGRFSRGLYVDEPQEWDDPYRFFRW